LYWNGNRAQTQKSYSGLEDEVDNRWGELFKAALLSTVLSVGAELGSGADTGNNQPFFRRCGSAPRIH
jgi:type IV secretory pathway VirB10-like protein